jgi:predicted nucleic acid-binding OB-fold protein
MSTKEFNKLVKQTKKDLLKLNAEEMTNRLHSMHLYRIGGIGNHTLDEILTEIAQAHILGHDFVDNIDINEEIKSL